MSLSKLTSNVLAQLRDHRLQDGVSATQHDLILIRHALKIAGLEWGVSLLSNPMNGIRIPNGIRQRERRLESGEYQLLEDSALSCKDPSIWPAVDFAPEIAMRRSEILALKWKNTDLDVGITQLSDTKNGTKRCVP